MFPIETGPLTVGVRLGLGPMVVGLAGREGAGFGNLENFSVS